jgi:hypothetical protein
MGINAFKEYTASIFRVKVSKVGIVAGYIEAVPPPKGHRAQDGEQKMEPRWPNQNCGSVKGNYYRTAERKAKKVQMHKGRVMA